MKFVPNAVTVKVARQALVLQKHSPSIMFGVGVVGVVATAVLASKATLGVASVLDEHEHMLKQVQKGKALGSVDYTEEDAQRDTVIVYAKTISKMAKLYAPAVGVGILSIALLTRSHVVLTRRNAAITAAYAALEKGYRSYRARVQDYVGEDKERELFYSSEDREFLVETKQGPKVIVEKRVSGETPSIYARFFDECSSSWNRNPDYNFMFLRAQQAYANDLLRARGHVFLNEIYDMIGIERTKAGAVVGWVLGNGDDYISFGMFDSDNEKARDFVNGREGSVLLDFNVDGLIYDKI